MKSSKANLFLVTLFICSSFKYASSIECYDCHSMNDPKCMDDYHGLKRKCPSSVSKCSIVTDFDKLIERKCGTESFMESDKDAGKLSTGPVTMYWSTCKTELCNWGVMNQFQMMTLILSAMLTLSVYYKY